ncbi:DUF4981 domain-containing protein [Marvinbryantia formatexigens]|uniref:DUF4981 domain-containing protein n=1 Tax=Marvinbryantia formatexigens TaxID=168384 RepID=UPI001A9A65E4|nr:DUF4981 domain-containing protein [Marvinbryantia formatexigens]
MIYGKVKGNMQITDIDIRVWAEKEGEMGNLEVTMRCSAPGKGFVCAQLLSEEDQEEDRIFPVPVEEEIAFCMQVSPVRLWDTERAYLYKLALELRDEQMRLLGCTVKKLAFQRTEKEQGELWLNEREIRLRPWCCCEEELREELELSGEMQTGFCENTIADNLEKRLRCWLAAIRRGRYNALFVAWENTKSGLRRMLAELCPEYGLYYDEETECGSKAEMVQETQAGVFPDAAFSADSERAGVAAPVSGFELNVTQEGVLLENHCLFVNASEYELRYALLHNGETVCDGSLCADVPPGSGRYIELPFAALHEAGEYVYRVSLHLKQDTPWAARGYEIAAGESLISNLFSA